MGSSKVEMDENDKYRRALAEYGRRQERQANALALLQQRTHEPDEYGRMLVRISVKVRWDTVGDVLVVLVTDGELGHQVAFGQGDEMIDALVGTANRWANGQLEWKEDSYAK